MSVRRTAAYVAAVLISMAAIAAVCSAMSGCASDGPDGGSQRPGADRGAAFSLEETNNTNINICTDEETGVQYIVYRWYKTGAGITPRLDGDGNVMVAKGGSDE